jgi:hypothetical protein
MPIEKERIQMAFRRRRRATDIRQRNLLLNTGFARLLGQQEFVILGMEKRKPCTWSNP